MNQLGEFGTFEPDLNSVERELLHIDGIHDAAVVPLISHPNRREYLILYKADPTNSVCNEVKQRLQTRLGSSLEGSKFERVNDIPRVEPCGTLDREKINRCWVHRTNSNPLQTSFSTPAECAVREIVFGVLRLSGIDIHDDFLGPNPDLATIVALILRIRSTFGVKLVVRELFQNFTIQKLAVTVQSRLRSEKVAYVDSKLLKSDGAFDSKQFINIAVRKLQETSNE